jgi:hypothetical protein
MEARMSNPEPKVWRPRLDTDDAADYLTDEKGLQTEPKTLQNWRGAGKGPAVQYYGQKPLYERAELDRWAAEDALTAESPLTRRARERAQRRPEREDLPLPA